MNKKSKKSKIIFLDQHVKDHPGMWYKVSYYTKRPDRIFVPDEAGMVDYRIYFRGKLMWRYNLDIGVEVICGAEFKKEKNSTHTNDK